jgi:hypothetical protein
LVGAVDNSPNRLPFIRKDNIAHDARDDCKYSTLKPTEVGRFHFVELHPTNDSFLPCRDDFRYKWKHYHNKQQHSSNIGNDYADTEKDDSANNDSEDDYEYTEEDN